MPVTAIVGEQRGDEGKGRFADMLAEQSDIVARFNGGPNAGHTVVLPDGRELALHMLPSGIAHDHAVNVIGNGTVIDPIKLASEMDFVRSKGLEVEKDRLLISSAAHLILPHHISIDEIRESGPAAQGSTKVGIAPAYADKAMRSGLRAETAKNDVDKLEKCVVDGLTEIKSQREFLGLPEIDIPEVTARYIGAAAAMSSFVTDTTLYLNRQLRDGKQILAEGAQAFLLDIDHGMYDAVTSSSTTTGAIFTGLGIPFHSLNRVIGVSKAIQSHVGGGPFATEVTDESFLAQLHGAGGAIDSEEGTTTGRRRRLGHFDLAGIKRAQMINGTTEMALTKLDWVPRFGKTILICTGYERDGKHLELSPDAAYKIEQSTPIYEAMPGWGEDVSEVRDFADLPPAAQDYVSFIEDQTELPITMIGVGPRRDQVIVRS